jgi:hypothetical protein
MNNFIEQNKIDLSQMSEIQLKALAYDEMSKLEMAQNNIRIINQELNNRLNDNKTKNIPRV